MKPDPDAYPSESRTESPPTWARVSVVALAALFIVIAWSAREPGVTTGNDDARYMLLAQAVREGTYRDLYQVGQGWHSLYPPAFPALLALVGGLFGESYDTFVALNIALTLGALLLFHDMARRRWSWHVALAAFALSVANASILYRATTWVMSEALYMALTAVAVWALIARPASARSAAVAIGAACLAALTRSIGVTLIAGIGLWWLLERRWKPLAGLVVVTGLTVLPWLAWTARAPAQVAGRSYVADAVVGVNDGGSGLVGTVLDRVRVAASTYAVYHIPVGLSLPTIEGTRLDNLAWLAIWGGLGLLGFVAIWKRARPLALYGGCYMGLLMVWPYAVSRFLTPVMPLLALALATGAAEVGRRLGGRREWAPLAALTTVLCACGFLAQGRFVQQRRLCDRSDDASSPTCVAPEVASFVAGARFARESLPPGTAVVVAKDASFAYLSGQPVVPAAAVIGVPEESFRPRMREVGAAYLFVGRVHYEDAPLAATLLPVCEDLVQVRAFDGHSSLLRLRDAATELDKPSCGWLAEMAERIGSGPAS